MFERKKLSESGIRWLAFNKLDRDIKLLKLSMFKWMGIAFKGARDRGDRDCPLCDEYGEIIHCAGCPIEKEAGIWGCQNTPYFEFGTFFEKVECNDSKKAALDMVRYLSRLLYKLITEKRKIELQMEVDDENQKNR